MSSQYRGVPLTGKGPIAWIADAIGPQLADGRHMYLKGPRPIPGKKKILAEVAKRYGKPLRELGKLTIARM